MTSLTQPEPANVKPRSGESYAQLDFANRARLPELDMIDDRGPVEFPPKPAVDSLVQRLFQVSIMVLLLAVGVGLAGVDSAIVVGVALSSLSVFSYAKYVSDRLTAEKGVIPSGLALRLTVGFAFLAITAFLTAVFH